VEALVNLERFLKKPSKLSDVQANEASTNLIELFKTEQSKLKIAQYLMVLKPLVCQLFFEKAIKMLNAEEIESLHTTLCSTDLYKKNVNHSGVTRGFLIAAVLIKAGHRMGRSVFMKTLLDAERDGKFSEAVVKLFRANVFEYCGGINLISGLENGKWNNPKTKDRFDRFMRTIRSGNDPVVNDPVVTPQDVLKEIEKTHSKLNSDLKESNREVQVLLAALREYNRPILDLQQEMLRRDAQISGLKNLLKAKEGEINTLQFEAQEKERMLSERLVEIDDLKERLKFSLKMDSISHNQELISLKNDLAKSLKIEYTDFIANRDVDCNADSFEAYRGSLIRIFRILRRLGIAID